MKIVITGALGHIGSSLIRKLPVYFDGAEIIMIDDLSTHRYCSLYNLPPHVNYRFYEADILKFNFKECLVNATVVIHLAAITDAESSFNRVGELERVNYCGTVHLADICANRTIPLIFLSTTSVYGKQSGVVDEACTEAELRPQSPYAESKLKSEKYLMELSVKGKLKVLIFRFGTICGNSPGMRFHTAINKFCFQAVMGIPLTVWETALHQARPYLTLEDGTEAICFAIKKKLAQCEVFNVVTQNLTVNEILSYIRENIPGIKIDFVKNEIMNQLSYSVSTDKFLKTGFKYKGSIHRSICETIHLLKNSNKLP